MIRALFWRLLADEDGAVTLDWLALTGAVAGVGVLGVFVIGQGLADISGELNAVLRDAQMANITFVETVSRQSSSATGAASGALEP